MKIYTSYFGNPKLMVLPKNTITVSIANTTPKWFYVDLKLDKFNPEWDLVNAFKTGNISFDAFSSSYANTLSYRFTDFSGIREYLMDNINALGKDCDTAILLCWEKDHNRCHRSVLAKLFPDEYVGEY